MVLVRECPTEVVYLSDSNRNPQRLKYSAHKLIPKEVGVDYGVTDEQIENYYKILEDHGLTNPYENDTNVQMEKTDMNTLYQITLGDMTKYGHKLAVNSSGLWVMEEKGTGEIVTVNRKFVEEVMPYTIGVQFEAEKDTYHYTAEKDKFTVNDFLLIESYGFKVVRVVGVDTKSKKATKELPFLGKIKLDK